MDTNKSQHTKRIWHAYKRGNWHFGWALVGNKNLMTGFVPDYLTEICDFCVCVWDDDLCEAFHLHAFFERPWLILRSQEIEIRKKHWFVQLWSQLSIWLTWLAVTSNVPLKLCFQEREFLKNSVAKIAAFHPNIVVVEKSVSRLAQEFLLDAGITLVFNVKHVSGVLMMSWSCFRRFLNPHLFFSFLVLL